MHQGPKNPEQNSPKLCLETIYNKNFEAAPANVPKKLNHLLSKCIAETKIKDFTLIKCSCRQPKDVDPCIDKFISSHHFTKRRMDISMLLHTTVKGWSGVGLSVRGNIL